VTADVSSGASADRASVEVTAMTALNSRGNPITERVCVRCI
jgi:hypothetical protein